MVNVHNFKIISGKHYSGKTTKLLHELYNYIISGKNPNGLKEPARIEIYAYNEELLTDLLRRLYTALTSTTGISLSLLTTSKQCVTALKRLPCLQRGLKVGCHGNVKGSLNRMLSDSEGIVFIDGIHEDLFAELLTNEYSENLEVVIAVTKQ